MQTMHEYTPETDALTEAIVDYTRRRIADPQPLDHPVPPDELTAAAGPTITPEGIGGEEALRIWADVLAPATITTDHPSFLAFVPGAPSKASVLFDLAVSASEVYGGSWLEGGGAVWAENQVLGWLAELAGMPAGSGGCFVSGGTAGNLSALVAARHAATEARGGERPRALADRVRRHRALVGGVGGARDGRRPALGPPRRARPPDRPRARGGARSRRPGRAVRRGRERRLDERRHDRRPRGHRGRVSRAGAVAARRRRLRRRGAPRAERPGAVPRHRARRLVHRRPAQVALRAVRLLRAHLSRTRAGAGGAPTGRLLPGRPQRDARVEPERLRPSPLPTPARAPAVVLARDLRDRRLPGRRRAGPRRSRGRRPRRSAAGPSSS